MINQFIWVHHYIFVTFWIQFQILDMPKGIPYPVIFSVKFSGLFEILCLLVKMESTFVNIFNIFIVYTYSIQQPKRIIYLRKTAADIVNILFLMKFDLCKIMFKKSHKNHSSIYDYWNVAKLKIHMISKYISIQLK